MTPSVLEQLYRGSLSLLTDLYQLTMAYGYWKAGLTERRAIFNLFFRKAPFQGGFTIAAGLAQVIDYLRLFRFSDDDLSYLASLSGNDGKPLFEKGFIEYLRQMEFSCDIEAVPEGTVVFPQEPLLRVTGPIIQAQLIETPLLNLINFQTLIATKATRVCMAAQGEPVLEFGLRRAQGIDGGLAASRAAYIGGCTATSNVLAGKLYNIPVRGTHAHSWVMSFPDEKKAFSTYAEAMPNNCVFLVDTYDTIEGIRNAIEAGRELERQGYKMTGIRLDSGDLAYLSIKAREMLDEAGFNHAQIVASNDLDENIVNSLKQQEARINVWGIGTKLVTAYDQPALGGVYKITAMEDEHGEWEYKIKLSEQAIKISNPGVLQVKRFYDASGQSIADMIYNELFASESPGLIVDPLDSTRRKVMEHFASSENLLMPVFRAGKLVYIQPDIAHIRARVQQQLASFHSSIKRFTNPHQYPVGLERQLHQFKTDLILRLRQKA